MEANLLNLILRRQARAAEAVDEDLSAAGHLRELIRHLGSGRGQGIDLFRRQRGREAVVTPLIGALVDDRDGLLQRDRQGAAVVWFSPRLTGGADEWPEAVHRHGHLIRPRREVREGGDAAAARPASRYSTPAASTTTTVALTSAELVSSCTVTTQRRASRYGWRGRSDGRGLRQPWRGGRPPGRRPAAPRSILLHSCADAHFFSKRPALIFGLTSTFSMVHTIDGLPSTAR